MGGLGEAMSAMQFVGQAANMGQSVMSLFNKDKEQVQQIRGGGGGGFGSEAMQTLMAPQQQEPVPSASQMQSPAPAQAPQSMGLPSVNMPDNSIMSRVQQQMSMGGPGSRSYEYETWNPGGQQTDGMAQFMEMLRGGIGGAQPGDLQGVVQELLKRNGGDIGWGY